ncbi:NAD-dependent epimerase/dehydratase family protein [Leeuwenhoekiella sp. NPDC079379]|uniref:NAD-dependent epimerase/dehydratase family protein n=1 Tax=Leeuwenhoekiella sp. NPDC079379 TaxID=3364122 RepID=UPI0037C5FFD2
MGTRNCIIGATGYIGKNLAYFLNEKGESITCYDLNDKGSETWMNHSSLDITNLEALREIALDYDYIYFFAGLTGTSQGFEEVERYNQVNVVGLSNLLTCMREKGSKARILFPSTRLVYKGVSETPLAENAEKDPKTIYALNKLTCESLLQMYGQIFNINYTVFRICVPYGYLLPEGYSYGTIGFFIGKAAKQENISLFGDGELRRTFTHVADICIAMYRTARLASTNRNIYNIGGENFSLKEAASLVASKYGVGLSYVDWPVMSLKIESGDTIFEDTKLKDEIGEYLNYNLKTAKI